MPLDNIVSERLTLQQDGIRLTGCQQWGETLLDTMNPAHRAWTDTEVGTIYENIRLGYDALAALLKRTRKSVEHKVGRLMVVDAQSRVDLPEGFRWIDDCVGHYSINQAGVVLRHTKRALRKHGQPSPMPQYIKDGYRFVSLIGVPHQRNCHVARLVLEAWVSICPPDMEVDHIDRNRSNNNLSNLRWVTRLENVQNKSPRKPKE